MGSHSDSLAERAVGHPHRAAILALLRDAPEGLGVADLASRLGIHANTTRWHLAALVDTGLVRSQPLPRGRPGRPGLIYEATGAVATPDGYRFLAELLASTLARSEDGAGLARDAGRAWGRHLVGVPSPAVRLGRSEAVDRVRALLAEHGFHPVVDDTAIEMRHCPFHDLVERYGSVLCALHGGLVEGALAELEAGVGLGDLVPFARPGVCIARLVPTAA